MLPWRVLRACLRDVLRFIRTDKDLSLAFGDSTTPLPGEPVWSDVLHEQLILPMLGSVSGEHDLLPFSVQILKFLDVGARRAADRSRGDGIGYHYDPPVYQSISAYNLRVSRGSGRWR